MAKRTLRETERSGLLRRAVADAREASKLSWVKLNMSVLVCGDKKHCELCMAGAVMLRINMRDAFLAGTMEEFAYRRGEMSLTSKLIAIDRMREGTFFGPDLPPCPSEGRVAIAKVEKLIQRNFNERLGRAPWKVYLQAARVLEEAGL